MLDISLLRNDPDKVRDNIRKKFQDQKLPLVDEVIALDKAYREAQQTADSLRNQRKVLSKQIGGLIGKGQTEEAEKVKAQVADIAAKAEGMVLFGDNFLSADDANTYLDYIGLLYSGDVDAAGFAEGLAADLGN